MCCETCVERMGFQGVILEVVKKIEGVGAIYVVFVTGLMVVLLPWIVSKVQQHKSSNLIPLPPGPPPLPVIGNLHMLGSLPHRALRKLSRKYGPLMFLRLGSVPTVVASSSEMAKQFLKIHDLNFASRPSTTLGKHLLYNSKDLAFAPYASFWTQMRKMYVLELLGSTRLQSLKFVRDEEISALIHSISEHCLKRSDPVNINMMVSALTSNIICRMVFGRRYSDDTSDCRGFESMVHELLYLIAAINIGDVIPWLEWIDLQGLRRRQKNCHKKFDAFLEKVIDQHIQQKNLHRDFVDRMLEISEDKDMEIKITRDHIKAVILDTVGAGVDTSATAIEWAMSELLKNPSVMTKVKEELQSAMGEKRTVEECDLPRLQYLNAVVKETLRLHPTGPLLIPHESVEECTVGGYQIPRKARVMVNVWAIHTDPKLWEDADIFKPERFIGSSIDVKGQNFEMLPFGSGRRRCPGMQLGILVVQCALANMLHCFDWRLPDGMKAENLDMSENFRLSMPMAVNLLAVPTARFP